jgi:RHS repeat-associated protein
MTGRSYSDTTYRYGFNGKEKDENGEFGGTTYDYGFRIYNANIARFLSVDPLTKDYPMLTPYQFASNSPIAGIDLDGLEFVLRIYSPVLSEKFNQAVDAKDIYEQRRITNYALNNRFSDDWITRTTQDVGSPPENSAATLMRDDNVTGVQVITYGYYNNDINTGKVTPTKSQVWEPSEGGLAPDAYYPVDVKEKSFYDSHGDFIATYKSGSAIQGYGGSATFMQGYLRGWGYVEYGATGMGFGDDAGASIGSVFGNFKGQGEMTPLTLTGKGWQAGLSLRLWGYGKWQGFADDAGTQIAWEGDYYSMAVSVSLRKFIKGLKKTTDIGGSSQNTNTTLLFPKPKPGQN